jgi:L-asparaginase
MAVARTPQRDRDMTRRAWRGWPATLGLVPELSVGTARSSGTGLPPSREALRRDRDEARRAESGQPHLQAGLTGLKACSTWLAALALLASGAHALSAQAPTPTPAPVSPSAKTARVRLVATGGTIANRSGGRLSAEELVGLVPQIQQYARVETEQFANVASGDLTLAQWLRLAQRLEEILRADPELTGLVVTSGTDTLEEIAYFLHLTVRTERPLVIVGSMRRPEAPGFDGTANLLAACRVAADPQSRGRGALVVLNDEIHSARDVVKTDAQRMQTFQTRPYGVLGVVDSDRIVYARSVEKRHTSKSEFDATSMLELPRVDVLLTYQAAPGDLVRAAVDAGARGVVLATAAGALSGTQSEAVRYALDRKVIVVRATRTGSGRIPAAQAPNEGFGSNGIPPGTLAAEDLAPIKARILLMLALTKTSDPTEIQRMFTEY